MSSEPLGAELIESYLQIRGSRYFRGRHDGEFFYLANTRPRRLHVHLETSPGQDVLVIRVAPASFFPAAQRSSLAQFVDTWNSQNREVTAVLHDSSDPERVGVLAHRSQWVPGTASFDDFATFVDGTLADAIELFGQLSHVADLSTPLLRDAS